VSFSSCLILHGQTLAPPTKLTTSSLSWQYKTNQKVSVVVLVPWSWSWDWNGGHDFSTVPCYYHVQSWSNQCWRSQVHKWGDIGGLRGYTWQFTLCIYFIYFFFYFNFDWWLCNIFAAFDRLTLTYELYVLMRFISNTLTLPLMVHWHMLSVDDCRVSVNQSI